MTMPDGRHKVARICKFGVPTITHLLIAKDTEEYLRVLQHEVLGMDGWMVQTLMPRPACETPG